VHSKPPGSRSELPLKRLLLFLLSSYDQILRQSSQCFHSIRVFRASSSPHLPLEHQSRSFRVRNQGLIISLDKLYWVSDTKPPQNYASSFFFCIDNVLPESSYLIGLDLYAIQQWFRPTKPCYGPQVHQGTCQASLGKSTFSAKYHRTINTRTSEYSTTARTSRTNWLTQPSLWERSWSSCWERALSRLLRHLSSTRATLCLSAMLARVNVTTTAQSCTVFRDLTKHWGTSGTTSRHSMSKSTSTTNGLTMETSTGSFPASLQLSWVPLIRESPGSVQALLRKSTV